MDTFKEFQGKDLDSAIEEACIYFNVNRNQLEIEIVRDAKSGIFGIVGTRKAEIRARRVRVDVHTQLSNMKLGGERGLGLLRDEKSKIDEPHAGEPAQAPPLAIEAEPSPLKPQPRKEHVRHKREKKRESPKAAPKTVHQEREVPPAPIPASPEPLWDAPMQEEFRPKVRAKSRRVSQAQKDRLHRAPRKHHATVTDLRHAAEPRFAQAKTVHSQARPARSVRDPRPDFTPDLRAETLVPDNVFFDADFLAAEGKDLFPGRLCDDGWSDDTRPLPLSAPDPLDLPPEPDSSLPPASETLGVAGKKQAPADEIPYDFGDIPEEIPDGLPLISREQISSPEFRETLAAILHAIIEPIIGMHVELQFEIYQNSVRVHIDSGDHSGLLIGREGQTLLAIQYLTSRILTHKLGTAVRLQLDAGEYRQRQEEKLHTIALALADRARQTGRTFSTRPLSSYHRRIIHLSLQDAEDIQTRSIGDGSMKRVIIMCKREKDEEKADVN